MPLSHWDSKNSLCFYTDTFGIVWSGVVTECSWRMYNRVIAIVDQAIDVPIWSFQQYAIRMEYFRK